MSFFRYEAVDSTGKIVTGAMDAPDEGVVNARLAQMGFRPQMVVPSGAGTASIKTGTSTLPRTAPQATVAGSKMGGVKAKELASFFRQLAALVRSGISVYQALDNLYPRTGNRSLALTAREMADAARTGGRISNVMEKYPRIYSPHVVGGVRAGELGGFLEIVLDEIALDYEQEIAFYKGLWLPVWMIVQGFFMLAIAQPLFPTLFPNGQLGTYLQLVFFRNIPIVLALMGLFRLYYYNLQLPHNREKRDRIVLRLPIFGELVRQKSLAAFVRMLRQLFRAGLGPISAWEGAMNVTPNSVLRAKLIDAYGMMRNNVPLHDAFTATGLFADEMDQLLATGVISGQMVDMLDRVAAYYQDNVDRAFSSARFWMFRLGFAMYLVLVGAVLIMMTKTYFTSVFNFADSFAPQD